METENLKSDGFFQKAISLFSKKPEPTSFFSKKSDDDEEKFVKFLTSSAENGNVNNEMKLGKLYFHGSGWVEYYDEEKQVISKKIVHVEKKNCSC